MITDCSSIDEQFLLDNYLPKRPNYQRIVNKYNECFPEGTTVITDIVVKPHLDFGIQGGLNWATPDFSSTNDMSQAKFGWITTGSVGGLVSLFTHHMGDRLRFNVEPSIGVYNGYSKFQNDVGTNDVHLRFKFLRMPAYFRLFVHRGFFIDMGLTNMVVVGQQSAWRIESSQFSSHDYLFTSDGPQYKVKSGVGAMAGLGGKFEIGGMPVFITARASSIFRPFKDLTATQPLYQWVDLGLAVQLTRK
ncbi:MAG: hypothetical protein WDO15_25420 [Bacteroidota bacterium]